MYKYLLKPILFTLPAELAHKLSVFFLRILISLKPLRWMVNLSYLQHKYHRPFELFGVTFQHPFGLAAGFDKNARSFNELSSFGFSFIEIGTVTPEPQKGNKKPRLFRLPEDKAIINRMGINNLGVKAVVKNLRKNSTSTIIGGNIGKNTATEIEESKKDFASCFQRLYPYVDYFTLNISCPNVGDLSKLQGGKGSILEEVVDEVLFLKKEMPRPKPILVKLSPDADNEQIDDIVEMVQNKGLDGFVISNTTVSRQHLTAAQSKVEGIGNGGLSGAPLKDRSTELISYVSQKTEGKLPIIGVGGVMTAEDAMGKIQAGAHLVQVYTGFIYNGPKLIKQCIKLWSKSFEN